MCRQISEKNCLENQHSPYSLWTRYISAQSCKVRSHSSFLCVPPVARRALAPNDMKWRSYLFLFHTRLLCLCLKRTLYAGRKSHSASTEITHNAKKKYASPPSRVLYRVIPSSCYSFALCPHPPTSLISSLEQRNRTCKMNNERLASMFYEVAAELFWRWGRINENITYLFVSRGDGEIDIVSKCIQRWTPGYSSHIHGLSSSEWSVLFSRLYSNGLSHASHTSSKGEEKKNVNVNMNNVKHAEDNKTFSEKKNVESLKC